MDHKLTEGEGLRMLRFEGIIDCFDGCLLKASELEDCDLKIFLSMFEDSYDLLFKYIYQYTD